MEYLGAWGTLIHEKNLKSKISCQTPFKKLDEICPVIFVHFLKKFKPLYETEQLLSSRSLYMCWRYPKVSVSKKCSPGESAFFM
jgi:hypothetical protein